MWKMFSAINNTVYWDKLDKLVDDYNDTYHSSIKMTPTEASKKEMKNKFSLICMKMKFTWNPKNQSFQSVIKLGYLNIRDEFLIKVTLQTGQKKYLLLIK